MADRNEKNPSKYTRRRKLLFCAMLFVCLYFVYTIASTQIEIYKQKLQLAEVDRQIEQQQLENDELSRVADGGEEEYIERIAREKLGYAAADERVFVDIAGAEEDKDASEPQPEEGKTE